MSEMLGRGNRYLNVLCSFAAAVSLCSSTLAAAAAPAAPGPNDAIYMYRGADRDQKLVEQAKKEGTVTLYSSLSSGESTPLVAAFEKKYGIKINFWRANSDQVAQRMMTEGQARRNVVDVLETNGSEVEMAARERLLSEFYSPYLADLPADAIGPNRLWVSDRSNFIVVAYNTNKIKRADLPATYEGFLDPKWKGQISIEASDIEWLATIVKKMGNDKGMKFFQSLSATKPEMRAGHILLAQMVGAGEAPVALTVYNGEVESLKRKGTPIDWAPVQPVVGRPQGLAVAKNAPHPYAALLLADFILSPENQAMYAKLGRIPTSTKVKTKLNDFPHVMIDTATVLDENDKWTKLWNELFLKK
ncbi:MAG TPA: extracellular solute-binding protein [Herbaspirillum sp.]|jgi:iron(III) transport system substrate-binding protein